jgi:hypothetical protein
VRPFARRGALAAALALVLVAGGTTAAAPSRPVAAKDVVLATGTTIEWTGAKGVRLHIPKDVTLPRYGARLHVIGGTYAHVRLSSDDRRCRFGHCGISVYLDHLRDATRSWASPDGPGAHHSAHVPLDGIVGAGTHGLYLFTDGTARLVFDNTSLPRAPRTYRAIGRINGGARSLPVTCPTVGCDAKAGYAGRVRVGGLQVDVGARGNVDVWVGTYDRRFPPTWQFPQSRYNRGCVYPHNPSDTTSPDPKDHPWGCDVVGEDADWTVSHAVSALHGGMALAPLYSGYFTGDGNPWASGKTYFGHQVMTSQDVSDPLVVAFGVWFAYGVH